ncbi:hypothetical protein NL387_26560, partial [Klebsiella pneumoniae]|nr:hypothetical protein [Klebsiella pneumoniae]
MSKFDELVETSRLISDAEVEAQPLWEYPSKCRGVPRKLIEIDFHDLKPTYAFNGVQQIIESQDEEGTTLTINGFALWAVWKIGGKDIVTG